MANHKSALKRIRQTAKRTARNRAAKSQLRTGIKKYRAAVASGDPSAAAELLSPTVSLVDRSVRKGIIHRNKGNRIKSSLAAASNKLANAAASSAEA